MKIGILGGTGREGTALALRWAASGEDVIIGSREEQRAVAAADQLNRTMGKITIRGASNRQAAEEAEVVVLTVPASAHLATLKEVREALRGKLVIDATVSLDPDAPGRLSSANHRSAIEEAQEFLGAGINVVAAFQNVSYRLLREPNRKIDCDVLVCGDDPEARQIAMALVEKAGLRALDAGPAHYARTVEGLTPLLLELNRRYKTKEAGIRITGLPEKER
ncbi:MAG: NADPH-dependent F420 reductase [Candidatus Methylomirabilis oxyfera]|nr:NADPH-dependent F420 reductase [Candidatus Methylomirabilis oxyfera]